jgi:hypothetical protein
VTKLRIKSGRIPWRRGGVAFVSPDWVEAEAGRLSDRDRLLILADPALTVETRSTAKADWTPVPEEERQAARLELHGDGKPSDALLRTTLAYEITGPADAIRMAVAVSAYLEAHPDVRPRLVEALAAAGHSPNSEGGTSAPAGAESPARPRAAKGARADGPAAGDAAGPNDNAPAARGGSGDEGAPSAGGASSDPAARTDASAEAAGRQDGGGDGGEG